MSKLLIHRAHFVNHVNALCSPDAALRITQNMAYSMRRLRVGMSISHVDPDNQHQFVSCYIGSTMLSVRKLVACQQT